MTLLVFLPLALVWLVLWLYAGLGCWQMAVRTSWWWAPLWIAAFIVSLVVLVLGDGLCLAAAVAPYTGLAGA